MTYTHYDKRNCVNELRGLAKLIHFNANPDGSRTFSANQLKLLSATMEQGANIIAENLGPLPGGRAIPGGGVGVLLTRQATEIYRACGRHLALIDANAPIDTSQIDTEGRLIGPCPECKLEGVPDVGTTKTD